MKWTYLLLDLGSVIIPFVLSFEKRVNYVAKWKFLFPAIFIVAAVFIVWDALFTQLGVWSFNDDYLLGVRFFGLPLEELLFFIAIPFACVFIYEVLGYFNPVASVDKYAKQITMGLAVVSAVLGAFFLDRYYSGVTYVLNAAVLFFIASHNFSWLGRFLRSYVIVLIPFFIVNGVLTALPVVEYNDLENMGLRIGSIPVEDISYGLLLLISVTYFYELFQSKSKQTEN